MQQFASNFLEQHARDNPDQMKQLTPYFISVLSQVNRGRVAKDRTLRILEREALKNEQAATIAADILSRISATTAVMDRGTIVEILLRIEDAFPAVQIPLTRKPVEVRGGV